MTEWTMKMREPLNRVWRHPRGHLEGCVITAQGIVYAYSQGGVHDGINDADSTDLQIVVNGRLYSRSIKKRYTQRGLVTVARRFAEEIANG